MDQKPGTQPTSQDGLSEICESLIQKLSVSSDLPDSDFPLVQLQLKKLNDFLLEKSFFKGQYLDFHTLQESLFQGQSRVIRQFETGQGRFLVRKIIDYSQPDSDKKARTEIIALLKIIQSQSDKLLKIYGIAYEPLKKAEIFMEEGIGTLRELIDFIESNQECYPKIRDEVEDSLNEQKRLLEEIGVYHNDVIPGNILIRNDHTIILFDFDKSNNSHSYNIENDMNKILQKLDEVVQSYESSITKDNFWTQFKEHKLKKLDEDWICQERSEMWRIYLKHFQTSGELQTITESTLERLEEEFDGVDETTYSEVLGKCELLVYAYRFQRKSQEASATIRKAEQYMKDKVFKYTKHCNALFKMLEGDLILSKDQNAREKALPFYKEAGDLNFNPTNIDLYWDIEARIAFINRHHQDPTSVLQQAANHYESCNKIDEMINTKLKMAEYLIEKDASLKELTDIAECCEKIIERGDCSANRYDFLYLKACLNARLAKSEAFESSFQEFSNLHLEMYPDQTEDSQQLKNMRKFMLGKLLKNLTLAEKDKLLRYFEEFRSLKYK